MYKAQKHMQQQQGSLLQASLYVFSRLFMSVSEHVCMNTHWAVWKYRVSFVQLIYHYYAA